MPAKNPDLHGDAPDHASAALVLIDVINDMEFPGGDRLLAQARPMATRLAERDDYFVLEPKHSAFYATVLDTLLDYLGAETLILTGITADICVMLTAADAFLRDLNVIVPADCVASVEPEHNREALRYMVRVLDADVRPADKLDLRRLREPRAA